ncbi:MAG: T9SS type A sorting domain-containing protein [Bacteroidetes bacterium]|nr:T9SS type A sorting domain-containing protein [Bacteroidota bacterium]
MLSSAATGASFQWIDCANGNLPIAGETAATFTATANGNYALIVTQNGCSDTSACFTVLNIGAADNLAFLTSVSIYPNPSISGIFTVEISTLNSLSSELSIVNMMGELIYTGTILPNLNKKYVLDLSKYSAGVYFATVKTKDSKTMIRLVNQ